MKVKSGTIILAILVSVAASQTVCAAQWQGWRGSGGWGMGGAYQRMYDPARVETVNGEVVGLEKTASRKGLGNGIHLMLNTGSETVPVHLGPAWYIERLDARIEKGDKLQVKGARVTVDGKPAIIAAEIRKGDALLQLRDSAGVPVWAGWRR